MNGAAGRRIAFWLGLALFFAFGLAYPLLYVFEGSLRVPPPARTLAAGDTLETFALRHEVSVDDLALWNGLEVDARPSAGRVLLLGEEKWGTAHFTALLSDPVSRGWLLNSLLLAMMVTLITFALALPLAFFSVRREFAGKSILSALVLVPMVLPPFVGAIGMQRMLSRFGSLNLILMDLGLTDAPIDFIGAGRFWGVAIFSALHLYPIMYLNLTAAMANVDPSLDEAAATLGDNGWKRFLRITLPLMLPGIFAGSAIVFVWAFTDLGTPLIFQYQPVVAKRIFDLTGEQNINHQGFALVVIVLLLTAGLFAAGRYLARRRPVASATKGASSARPVDASALERRLAYALFGGVTLVALLPHVGVLLEAFAGRWFMTVLPSGLTAGHVESALTHPISSVAVRNSLLLSLGSTAVDLVIGVMIAVFIVRSRSRLVPVVDTLAMLPLAIPGIILAFGYIGAYSGGPAWLSPRENPALLLIVAYSMRRLPFVVRAAVAGLEQTPKHLEEASLISGASPLATLKRVTLPLIGAHLIAGGIMAFTFAMLEVSDSLVLATREQSYPITKAIYFLSGRLSDGSGIACALGLFGVMLLTASLAASSTLVGRKMGEMFRV